MSRKITFIIVLLWTLQASGQDSTRIHAIGFSAGASYCNGFWSSDTENKELMKTYIQGVKAVFLPSASLNYAYYISPKITLVSGLTWMPMGFNNRVEQGGSTWHIRTRYHYLSIPVGAGTEWKFGSSKSSLKLNVGLYALLRLKEATKLSVDDESFQNPVVFKERASSMGFGVFTRVGWRHYINEHYSLDLDYTFSQNLSKTTDTPVHSYLHNSSVMLTLSKFINKKS
jgi:hypothetical protein